MWKANRAETLPTEKDAREALTALKQTLIGRGEATHLFVLDRDNGLKAIPGNLAQTVFGEPAYPTLESKAAHLLYFMVNMRDLWSRRRSR